MKISKRKMALLVASAGLSFSALTGCSSQQQKEDDEDREGGVVVPASNSYIKHSSKSSTENGIQNQSQKSGSTGKSGLGSGKASAGS